MKKILSFFIPLLLAFSLDGCSFYENFSDINVSEIVEVVESQLIIPEPESVPALGEISYDEPFVYNTYYDFFMHNQFLGSKKRNTSLKKWAKRGNGKRFSFVKTICTIR